MPRVFFCLFIFLTMAAQGPVAAAGDAGGEPADRTGGRAAVGAVLDELHLQASRADGDAYFALFTADAVFIGTDVTERWPLDAFKEFALPRFATGVGWTYHMTERNIDIAPGGGVAWFHEVLWNDNYGTTRGTGVLVRGEGGWKIAQYHLTIPIPNDLAAEMADRIKAFEEK